VECSRGDSWGGRSKVENLLEGMVSFGVFVFRGFSSISWDGFREVENLLEGMVSFGVFVFRGFSSISWEDFRDGACLGFRGCFRVVDILFK